MPNHAERQRMAAIDRHISDLNRQVVDHRRNAAVCAQRGDTRREAEANAAADRIESEVARLQRDYADLAARPTP